MKYVLVVITMLLFSCKKNLKIWQFEREIKLNNVHPIGGVVFNNQLWISDGDGNRLVAINKEGEIIDQIVDLERPMHIDAFKETLFIPEYGKDVIAQYKNQVRDSLVNVPELDAPAAVSVYNKELAIADFYNNIIHFYDGNIWIKIGGKGTDLGQLNYPTDVQITQEFIYVADAYNHRIQVFDKKGVFVKVLASDFGINAATGLLIVRNNIYVTDFENNRVLILSKEGELLQVITDGLNKPTDILVVEERLYVLNYKSGSVSQFLKK